METPQLTGRVLLCLLLIIGPSADLSSWLWWTFNTEWAGRRHSETPPNSWPLQDEPLGCSTLEWIDGREIEAERFEHYEERQI